MSWGRKALAAIVRDCAQEIKACGPRAEMYNQHQEDGRPYPIGVHGQNFGSVQWHLGFAAGIQWAQMRMEWALMGTRPGGAPYPDVPPEHPTEDSKMANKGCFVVPDYVQDALEVVLQRQFQLGLTVAARGSRSRMTDADYKPAADALRELMRAIDAAMCGRPANA